MTGKSFYRWGLLALILAGLLFLSGCQSPAPQAAHTPPEDGQESDALQPQIPPAVEEEMIEQRKVTLYYRMQGEDLLAAEARSLYFPKDKQVERILCDALTDGPSASLLDMTTLFSSGAKVYNVWRSNDLLTVVLTREFLMAPSGAPDEWYLDELWNKEVYMRRRLALTSIVNTITEATNYTAVQFLVLENSDDTTGRRLRLSELYEEGAYDQLLSPMVRNESQVLTHFNTANIIMETWQNQTYERMYRFVAREATQRPTESTFLGEMRAKHHPLTYFSISAGMVSEDGQSAVLEASYEYKTDKGTVKVQNYPLKLVRENGLWKISYTELRRMMEAI